jgi:hypothetical protein
MIYVCAGKVNRYYTNQNPKYTAGTITTKIDRKFIDFLDYFVGYRKTPQELALAQPYPAQYIDKDGRIWYQSDATSTDNHQFRVGGQNIFDKIAEHGTTFIPRNYTKYPQHGSWDIQTMGSTIQEQKKKGLIK